MKNKLVAIINETDEKMILKRSAFWNMIASVINSTLSSILLFFITRLNGVTAAGMFSIASAIAYQCLSLGNFGTRNVQASDVKKEFSFSDFFFIKVFSGVLMYSMLIYYSFATGYSTEKAWIVFTFGLFKSIDALEDVIHGEYHRNNRLDIAAILLTFRYIVAVIEFVIIYMITKDLIITSSISCITTVLICFLENKSIIKHFYAERIHFNCEKFKKLLVILIPISVSNYVRMYVCNLPKYSIDANLTESVQTYFNILIMPVFIITLLSDVIFRPYITKLSIFWHQKNIFDFKRLIFRQLFIVVAITSLMVIGGYIIGLDLLEFVYGIELSEFMIDLLVLLIAGGLNTASAFLTLVLTIQREQKTFIPVYIITTVLSMLIANPLVSNYGIDGAVFLYFIICFIFFIVFGILVILKNRKVNG